MSSKLQTIAKSLPIAIIYLSLAPAAIAQNVFGDVGERGQSGRDGRSGRDGQNIKIVGDGKPSSHDLTGTDGEDGEDATTGRSASRCEQPFRPEYSLVGAAGGNGGNGGNGGSGGNGGNALIFYTDLANLQQIEIRNRGGRGGRNGRGASGGHGCECKESEWRIKYCDIETQRRPHNDAKAAWVYHSRESRICGRSRDGWGFDLDFEREYNKSSEYRRGDWLYRRTNKGVTRTNYYSCSAGRDGSNGNDGQNGATGSYGRVTLVPRLDIPTEITSDRAPLADALNKKVPLIKNIWVERSGLSRLLRSSSDVGDRYTYLKDTARLFYRFEWAAQASPSALGVDRVAIGAAINIRNENAEITYQLPGTLEYQVMPANPENLPENLQVVKITGGFNPDRVSTFEIAKISGASTDNQVSLSDRGNVRELLQDTQIQVQCFSKESATGIISNDYVERRAITFKIPPKFAPSNGAIVNGNNYSLPVGRYCSPWLRQNNNVLYKINISQTTKSGAVYEQNLESAFNVNP